ncbi:MAG: two component, sigma54 specific, transcriptional regulator, fis family [Parcubacteria group bacterium Gr01-1014_30]|nr:MAG: two component, sigma54 specific, transcriptional regulator, fis family [Parcubacteria group bacterium Gr01-1014_30]
MLIIGGALSALRSQIERVALSDSKVLITGPTGAGKELVAQEIHRLSYRAQKPLVTINCAALTDSLLETELFGHIKGSFTGAYRDQRGKLEQAHLGTIFLDEIGDMALSTQARVLRFLESGEIQPVGDAVVRKVEVRVITATSADLQEMVSQRSFRKDLYYRIKVLHIEVPPLKDHTRDIPELVEHFSKMLTGSNGREPLVLSNKALAVLQSYDWPGNVRELKNVVENLVLGRQPVDSGDLPREILEQSGSISEMEKGGLAETATLDLNKLYRRITEGGESFWELVYPAYMNRDLTKRQARVLIDRALRETRGNYKAVARLLNVGDTLKEYKRFLNFIRKYDLKMPFMEYRMPKLR